MKFDQIITQESKELDEVRMGKSDLQRFVDSPEAEGIYAGFEAELCFNNLGGSGESDYDAEPEPNYDDNPRPGSIQQICDFYYDGDHNGRRSIERLREQLLENYLEWQDEQISNSWSETAEEKIREYIENNVIDIDDEIEERLEDQGLTKEQIASAIRAGSKAEEITSSKQLSLFAEDNEAFARYVEARDEVLDHINELVANSLENQDEYWDSAYEEYREEQREEETFDEDDWLSDEGITSMSDVEREYTITWPHWTYPEEESDNSYNEDGARTLSRSLESMFEELGEEDFEVKYSSGYHTAKRTDKRWILEPDSSLEADSGDMPVEIISPPMPLKKCLTMMEKFFSWAKEESAYSNDSTGLHVGVSLPNIGGGVDYVKLALFLGDKHILEAFSREANTYCKSAYEKIVSDIKRKDADTVVNVMTLMKEGLIERAALQMEQAGHGKYTSINMKPDYVEFRSMGGQDYLGNVDTVLNTVQRYAYAMSIAGNEQAERQEYAKKLYKLLSKAIPNKDILEHFVRYSAGELPTSALKSFVKQEQLKRGIERKKSMTEPTVSEKKYWWRVNYDNAGIEVVASSETEAKNKARVEWNLPTSRARDAEITATPLRPYEEQTSSQPDNQQQGESFSIYPVGRPWEVITIRANDIDDVLGIASRRNPEVFGNLGRTDVRVSRMQLQQEEE